MPEYWVNLERENKELRAENGQWRTDWLNMQATNERLISHHFDQHGACSMGGNVPCSHAAENKRLRAALELIADCDCKDCEDAAAVAREALARDKCR
jgi:hypothetical protein